MESQNKEKIRESSRVSRRSTFKRIHRGIYRGNEAASVLLNVTRFFEPSPWAMMHARN